MKLVALSTLFSCLAFGAISHAGTPSDCFDYAGGRGLSDDQKVVLCSGATTTTSVDCFGYAGGRGLSDDQKIRLCAGAAAVNATVDCFDQASGRGLSDNQKIRLCNSHP